MIQTIKQNKKAVLAFLLALVMVIGFIPFTTTEVHAQEIDLADVTDATDTAEGTTLKIFGDTELGIEKLYTYKSGNWTPDDGKNYIAKVDDIAALQDKTLQAVSPATASATEFTIPADQSTAENLLSADWCVSDSVLISDSMSFQLSHMLSKVTVVVSEVGEGYEMPTFDGTNNYIRFTSFTDVTYGDTLCKTDEHKTEIKPLLSTTVEGKQAFTAIVYPVSNGESLLSMYLNNDTTGYAFLSSLSTVAMEPGKHYTFNLTIKTNEIELTLVSVNPFKDGWSNEVNLDGSEETIGKEDIGKTDWANGDAVTLSVTGGGIAGQTETITYTDGKWSDLTESFKYLTANDTITATATYAPDASGLSEHLQVTAEVESGKVTTINFPQTRTYSRLRIASQANKNYTVTVTGFTPTGRTKGDYTYAITTDSNGNAFLYGSWEAGSKITVKFLGYNTIVEEIVTSASEAGKSYVLDAQVIDASAATVTVSGTYTYNGTAQTPSAANVKVVLNGTTLISGTNYTFAATNNVNAGTATVTVTFKGLYVGTATGTFTINKANPSYTVPTGLTAKPGDTLANVALPAGFSWESATSTSVGNSGTNYFTVKFTPQDTANYNVVTGIRVSITVVKPAATVTKAPTVISGLVYNGSAQRLANAGTASGGTMQYSLDNISWGMSVPIATNIGTYTVYYKAVGDANHSDSATNSFRVSIRADGVKFAVGDRVQMGAMIGKVTYCPKCSALINNATGTVNEFRGTNSRGDGVWFVKMDCCGYNYPGGVDSAMSILN